LLVVAVWVVVVTSVVSLVAGVWLLTGIVAAVAATFFLRTKFCHGGAGLVSSVESEVGGVDGCERLVTGGFAAIFGFSLEGLSSVCPTVTAAGLDSSCRWLE